MNKQTVYFSKTERVDDTHWKATVSPASMRKGVSVSDGDYVSDNDFFGIVKGFEKNELLMWCRAKFPCVGREYTIERK